MHILYGLLGAYIVVSISLFVRKIDEIARVKHQYNISDGTALLIYFISILVCGLIFVGGPAIFIYGFYLILYAFGLLS